MSKIEYKDGSIRELWRTSVPLMFSWLSIMMMIFVDRLYLAKFSLEALNSTVTSSMLVWAFSGGLQVLCEMVEVFVAQYNGAKRYKEIGKPVWQMIWLALMSVVIYLPLGLWGGKLIFPSTPAGELQNQFFEWLILFAPICGIFGACTAFYVGRGKTLTVTLVAICGNVVNIIVDPILIFGIDGYIPSMGVKGAAIATSFSILIQTGIMLTLFLRKENRMEYNTSIAPLDFKMLWECLKVGLPISVSVVLELVGWATFYALMSYASVTHISVAGICQSILMLFLFFGIGLEKGICTVGGNLIGAGRQNRLSSALKSGLMLVTAFFFVTCIPLLIYPDIVIEWFLNNAQYFDHSQYQGLEVEMDQIKEAVRFGLGIICFYLLFENVRWIASGLLSAAGDTFFLMVSSVVNIWIFLLAPIWISIVWLEGNVWVAQSILLFYSVMSMMIVYIRYFKGNWLKKQLIEG